MEQPSTHDFHAWIYAMNLLVDERNLLKNPVGRWLAVSHFKWL